MALMFIFGRIMIRPDQIIAVEFLSETEAKLFTSIGAFEVPIESQEDLKQGMARALAGVFEDD